MIIMPKWLANFIILVVTILCVVVGVYLVIDTAIAVYKVVPLRDLVALCGIGVISLLFIWANMSLNEHESERRHNERNYY